MIILTIFIGILLINNISISFPSIFNTFEVLFRLFKMLHMCQGRFRLLKSYRGDMLYIFSILSQGVSRSRGFWLVLFKCEIHNQQHENLESVMVQKCYDPINDGQYSAPGYEGCSVNNWNSNAEKTSCLCSGDLCNGAADISRFSASIIVLSIISIMTYNFL